MASGDIWSTGAFSFESPLKDLLDSLDYSLEDLLAEDEILQELRGLHPQLVTFFSTEENVAGLIRCLVTPPPPFEDVVAKEPPSSPMPTHEDEKKQVEEQENVSAANEVSTANADEEDAEPEPDLEDIDISRDANESDEDDIVSPGKWLLENTSEIVNGIPASSNDVIYTREDYETIYIRFPYMACEIICCEVPTILDILVEGYVPKEVEGDGFDRDDAVSEKCKAGDQQSILDLLFSSLFDTPSSKLDDRRAGYLEKILTMLFRKKRIELTSYINGDNSQTHPSNEITASSTVETQHNGDETLEFTHHQGGGILLLEALFKHLYSNSIAQILQRLLMPRPPSYSDQGEETNEEGSHDEWPLNGEDDDEDDGDMEEYGGISCDWADSEISLNHLLDHLLVRSAAIYSEGHPVSKEEETELNASQHACEILTTVIQHSPLSSKVMKTMTGENILDRLINCACGTMGGSTLTNFSMHDSTMTTAMNVLEILILQLGGYGTVPTGLLNSDFDEDGMNSINEPEKEDNKPSSGQNNILEPSKEDEAKFLIRKLPEFLSCLCGLLRHPDTNNWKSTFQYCSRPLPMLGASRLRIVRLIESLVLLSIKQIDNILCGSECLQICLDLFWEFPWCSMLHQSVANLLVHVLEGGEDRVDLQIYFLTRCDLPRKLMNSFDRALFSPCGDNEEEDGNKDNAYVKDSSVLAIKDIVTNSTTSSVRGEHGSVSSTSGTDLPVSDDDIDAAIEQEEQMQLNNESTLENGHALEPFQTTDKQTNAPKTPATFRMGYMGHVIIICQALVHACGSMEQVVASNEEKPEVVAVEVSKDYGPRRAKKSPNGISNEDLMPRPPPRNMILTLLRGNYHYSRWNNFVNTTLASETTVQSTPLGGYNAQEEISTADEHHTESTWDSNQYEHDFNSDIAVGSNHYIVSSAEIEDLDETDLDIAASMMESMNITPPEKSVLSEGDSSPSQGHRRQRGVIVGHATENGSAFGTVVELHNTPDEYVYDDPLGPHTRMHFDDSGSSDDSSDSDNDSDNDNVEGSDDAPPIMDLFAGNFDFDESSESDDAGGWANFEDAFSEAQTEFPLTSKETTEDPPLSIRRTAEPI